MNTISRTFRALALASALGASACASYGHVSQTEAVPATNNVAGVAVKGYDPVAYFTDMRPVPGNPAISTTWQGARYVFASEEHKAAFIAKPDTYAPQFGGFCAFAISRGTIADIDPSEWAVQNDHLYLNNNAFAQRVWNSDRPGNIKAGDQNWPLIPKKPVEASVTASR